MKLRLHAIRISLATNRGPYGVTARFTEGLNVIRAENTSGKSAVINGMLYALGLEMLAGKRGVEATKPVLRSDGEYGGEEFQVVESFVELEMSNSAGDVVTVRRFIAGERDWRLVEVLYGPVITGDTTGPQQLDTFSSALKEQHNENEVSIGSWRSSWGSNCHTSNGSEVRMYRCTSSVLSLSC